MANVAVLAAVWLLWRLADGRTMTAIVAAMLALGPGIIYYGYFLSSQICSRCREPIFHLQGAGLLWRLAALLSPLHVPTRCPHCGTITKW